MGTCPWREHLSRTSHTREHDTHKCGGLHVSAGSGTPPAATLRRVSKAPPPPCAPCPKRRLPRSVLLGPLGTAGAGLARPSGVQCWLLPRAGPALARGGLSSSQACNVLCGGSAAENPACLAAWRPKSPAGGPTPAAFARQAGPSASRPQIAQARGVHASPRPRPPRPHEISGGPSGRSD